MCIRDSYNLIRRAYWVNGIREKARTLPCPIADVPLGYCVLLTNSGSVVGRFEVDGKVTSLNSYLTPDSEYYELVYGGDFIHENNWIADVDYAQYRDSDNEEERGWAEQARMRANRTASSYNAYLLDNSYVWAANVPTDIQAELPVLTGEERSRQGE